MTRRVVRCRPCGPAWQALAEGRVVVLVRAAPALAVARSRRSVPPRLVALAVAMGSIFVGGCWT